MLKIGDFSKLSRISIRMLRHYNELGLLVPKSIDDFTGYRYYAEEQLSIAERVAALNDMGFSLATIGEILKSYDNPQALAELFDAQIRMYWQHQRFLGRIIQNVQCRIQIRSMNSYNKNLHT